MTELNPDDMRPDDVIDQHNETPEETLEDLLNDSNVDIDGEVTKEEALDVPPAQRRVGGPTNPDSGAQDPFKR